MTARQRSRLSLADVERNASSYVDPNGYVFSHEGTIYRAIRKSVAPFYRRLFEDRTIEALIRDRHLVPSTMTDLEIDDPDVEIVVRHDTVAPISYCVEWPPEMLRRAGLVTIDLLCDLLTRNATLQDAYPWNILFRGAEPLFVDLTSIVEIDTPYLWPAHDQFQAFFLRPLALASQGKGSSARALMLNNISGVTRRDFHRHASFAYKLAHPAAGLGHLADRFIQGRPELKRRLRRAAQRQGAAIDDRLRTRFYKKLRHQLEAFRFERSTDVWSDYYREIGPGVDRDAKLRILGDLLDRLRPDTVVDIGCNTGAFSVLAAERGARVIAVDSSEACIDRLYNRACADSLPITPLISDILCPTPAFGFMGVQYPSLIDRAGSETALCLALMHHLHISGRQSFDRIARLMDALAGRHLIFEFVAMDDDNNDLLGAGRKIDYDLESVTVELRRYFPAIETFASDRPTRKILLCSKG